MPRGVNRDGTSGKYKQRIECTNKQIDVIYSLVYEDLTVKELLAKHEVAESTYYGWYAQELFTSRLKEERSRKFTALSSKALKKLDKLMDCGDKRTELRAAELVLKENGHLDRDSELTEKTTEIVITLADNNE